MKTVIKKDFKIIKAKAEHIPLLLQFIKELASYEKLSDKVTASESDLQKSLFGRSKNAEAIIAYYQNQPVAFALYFHNFSTFVGKKGLYLEDIYVKPEMRDKGIGKKIFNYLIQLAIKRDCGRVEWAVLDWNKPAIEFYKSIGAKAMDEWTVFRLESAALLIKKSER